MSDVVEFDINNIYHQTAALFNLCMEEQIQESEVYSIVNDKPVFTTRSKVNLVDGIYSALNFTRTDSGYNVCLELVRAYFNIINARCGYSCWRISRDKETEIINMLHEALDLAGIGRAKAGACMIIAKFMYHNFFDSYNWLIGMLVAKYMLVKGTPYDLCLPISKVSEFKKLAEDALSSGVYDKFYDYILRECIVNKES